MGNRREKWGGRKREECTGVKPIHVVGVVGAIGTGLLVVDEAADPFLEGFGGLVLMGLDVLCFAYGEWGVRGKEGKETGR